MTTSEFNAPSIAASLAKAKGVFRQRVIQDDAMFAAIKTIH
jgi:hypothetical protein